MTSSDKPGAEQESKVISLEEWRQKVESVPQEEVTEVGGYRMVDPLSWQVVRATLVKLNGPATPTKLGVVAKESNDPTRVDAAESDNQWLYAVNINSDDKEMVMLDLQLRTEQTQSRLRGPLSRMLLGAIIAHHAITRDHRIKNTAALGDIHIEGAEFRIAEPDRLNRFTSIRAAAGLALTAATPEDYPKRQEVRTYLDKLLLDRYEYAQGWGLLHGLDLNGMDLPCDGLEVTDRLVGFCKPLNAFELNGVFTDPNAE